MTTLADLIERNARMRPDAIATVFGARVLTYNAFATQIEAVAGGLAAEFDVARGDRIAHLGYNSDAFLVLLFACARLGAILVPLNWRLAAPEHGYVLAHAEPRLLVVEPIFAERAAGLVAGLAAGLAATRVFVCDPALAGGGLAAVAPAHPGRSSPSGGDMGDPLLLVYTSGTTGRPKGALLTQAALLSNAVNSWHMHGLTARDHILAALPMFHVGGLNIQTVPALLAGARVTILDRFAPDTVLDALAPSRAERPSLLVLVPATMEAVLAHPQFSRAHVGHLRCLTTGSTIVPETLVQRFAELGTRVIQVYGATETGPIVIYERFDTARHGDGTTGTAGLLNDARIVDDAGCAVADGVAGEIAVRGPNILAGYWRDDDATAAALADGWFLTGDIGVRDAAGHFSVRDRKKNVIISGGENVYPAEIERVLGAAPGIAECAVVGRPDAKWQEVAVAFVVATPGTALDLVAINTYLAANLARFKLPQAIIVRDALPKTALGKVQHFALKAELGRR